ncbi:hypothetical protein V2I01_12330 [Micromonospora sp. BRA006-A]|nr:hypothetical protein [Micromonospora sp. BRA006-A]
MVDQTADDAAYNALVAGYLTGSPGVAGPRDEALAAAETAGDEFEARLRAGFSPVNEMVSQIVESHFPASVRDEAWEIDFGTGSSTGSARRSWRTPAGGPAATPAPRSATPATSSTRAGRSSTCRSGPAWSRPRCGGSSARWRRAWHRRWSGAGGVRGRADDLPDRPPRQRRRDARADHRVPGRAPSGSTAWRRWTELMPTDGTHLEVVQGVTTAADAVTAKEISDAEALRRRCSTARCRPTGRTKAYDQMTEPADVDIRLGTPPGAARRSELLVHPGPRLTRGSGWTISVKVWTF